MARRLAKFFHLALSDQRLLMRAAIAVVAARVAVRTVNLPAARATVTRLQRLGFLVTPSRADRIVWAVEAAGRALPGMKNCLVQAVAAEAMLLRAGYPCELRIGAAKKGPRELIAHAWLESEGRVLIGEFEVDRYTPFASPHPQGVAPPAQR